MIESQEHILVVQMSGGPESFMLGGTIARLVAEGNQVTVLTCSQPINAQVREAENGEIFHALMDLKVTNHRYLGTSLYRKPSRTTDRRYYLPEQLGLDGSTGSIPVPTESEAHPGTNNIPVGVLPLSVESIDELENDFATIMTEVQPNVLLLALPEHLGVAAEIVSELAVQSGAEGKVPVYRFVWEIDPKNRHYKQVDVRNEFETKRSAVARHHSLGQLSGDTVEL
ncbi:MAG: hypothetical protein WBA28_07025, partial [Microbacteriaceae bacterium]